MAAPNVPEKEDDIGLEERAAFLSAAPRSGDLSPFAQKLAAQAFVWICSVVVFGSTIDYTSKDYTTCSALCRYAIAAGILSFLFTSAMLIGQYLTWSNYIDKSSWLSPSAEKRGFILLMIWWAIGVATLSALEPSPLNNRVPVAHTSKVAVIFGWLAFFGSIYGAYKAYHSGKEEQRSLHYAQIMSIQATEEEEYANFS